MAAPLGDSVEAGSVWVASPAVFRSRPPAIVHPAGCTPASGMRGRAFGQPETPAPALPGQGLETSLAGLLALARQGRLTRGSARGRLLLPAPRKPQRQDEEAESREQQGKAHDDREVRDVL